MMGGVMAYLVNLKRNSPREQAVLVATLQCGVCSALWAKDKHGGEREERGEERERRVGVNRINKHTFRLYKLYKYANVHSDVDRNLAKVECD